VLGNLNDYDPSHLHFGIHPGTDYPSDENPWRGFIRETEYATANDTYGWVDPIEFLETHAPETDTVESSQSTTDEPVEAQSNSLGQDAICLATALMSEASVGTYEERVAVAWTIFNRVDSPNYPNTICEVVNQRGQYAANQEPTQELLDLADSLIADRGADPTGGATYFFSPISMPKEGESTGGYDVGGGLHEVAGIDGRVYFPSWALANEHAGEIPGVRPDYYMFYRDRPANDQVTLTLYVHEGSADGPVLSDVEVTGQDAAGSSFSQTTDANGYVVITGLTGSWQLTATKAEYAVNSWSQEIMETCTKHAYLFPEDLMTDQESERDVQEPLSTSLDQDHGVVLSPGWDIFNRPISAGSVTWNSLGTNLNVRFELSGADPNHKYALMATFFDPDSNTTLQDLNQIPSWMQYGSIVAPRFDCCREGICASGPGEITFGYMNTDSNGDGISQFNFNMPTGVYYTQFSIRNGECWPGKGDYSGCGVVYRTGEKYGSGFEMIAII
jgi:hypothetical protein